MALAALMRLGDAAPPAPKEFMADQMPGQEKLQRPTMVMLKRVERYHFTVAMLASCSCGDRGGSEEGGRAMGGHTWKLLVLWWFNFAFVPVR